MRLSFVDRPLQDQLSSNDAMRASWGVTAGQVQICLALLDAAAFLGDLLSFACLSVRAAPEGVLVTHRDATVTITPLNRRGHQIKTNGAWRSAELPSELREAERARIDGLQIRARAGSVSGRVS